MIVLVFGAASDYALLLIHRYREELCRHAATEDAMAVALRRTLPTLLTIGERVWWPARPGHQVAVITADSDPLKV